MTKFFDQIIIIAVAACGLVACTARTEYRTIEGATHTYYRIKYSSNHPLDTEIKQLMSQYYRSINPFDSTSIITAVNNNVCLKTDSLFSRAFRSSENIFRATQGMFDPTCAPFINYWGFGFKKNNPDAHGGIDSLRQFVGFDKITMKGDSVIKKDPRVMLNFSAIGDGFLCDLIAELLERNDIHDYLVDVGGEMRAAGVNPKGNPWTVGINKPVDDSLGVNHDIVKMLSLKRKTGIATSGNYRNFHVQNGKKLAHTINPITGMPAETDILSATVMAPDATTADGFATAFMAMGREKAKIMAQRHPELAYCFIYADEQGNFACDISPNMAPFIK